MKVPVSTPQTCHSTTSKPLSCDNTTLNTTIFQGLNTTTPTTYEPTSVLELQRSPSPTTATTTATATATATIPSIDLDNLEGWDSILSELGIHDDYDSHHLSQLPDFPSSNPFDHIHIQNNPPPDYNTFYNEFQNLDSNLGPLDHFPAQPNNNLDTYALDFIDDLIQDDLIQAAQCFESNDSHQLHQILTRLNQWFRSPTGKPLHRAAFYFKEALQHLLSGSGRPKSLSSLEVVNTIRAFKTFSAISPVSLFSAFAANQAVLEAVDGSVFVHIIDFDIGFGGHWSSFMRDFVEKFNHRAAKPGPVVLRVTAIVPDEFELERKLVRENLSQFAGDLNINFYIDFVMIQKFEISSFKVVKFIEGERIAVHLSQSAFQRIGRWRTGISKFLADLRGISPSVVVVVDKEVGIDTVPVSFSVNFIAGMKFYTRLMESLDMAFACGGGGGGGESVKRIELFVLWPSIMAAVEAAVGAERRTSWREAFVAAGMKAVGFSQFSDYQAECLLSRAPIGRFHLAKRHGEMMLCWRDRALVSTSAWRC